MSLTTKPQYLIYYYDGSRWVYLTQWTATTSRRFLLPGYFRRLTRSNLR